jgi:D-sedoheptulose 7-phosphate isomerase
MLERRIQQQLFDSADTDYQAAETLARPAADAAQALLAVITGGGKVMVCGEGNGAWLARYFEGLLVGGFERERPPLAAVALAGPDAGRQVQAIGQPGDIVLAIDSAAGESGAMLAAADAAHDKEISVVVLGGAAGAAWQDKLTETDVSIVLPPERRARVVELQLLLLHAVADAIDLQLLGEQES